MEFSEPTPLPESEINRLADCGDKSAIPLLSALLDGPYDVKYLGTVAAALGELGANSVVPKIMSLMRDPKTLGQRGSLAYALTYLDCSNVIDELVVFITDPYFEVRQKLLMVITAAKASIPVGQRLRAIELLKCLAKDASLPQDICDDLESAEVALRD